MDNVSQPHNKTGRVYTDYKRTMVGVNTQEITILWSDDFIHILT